MNDIFQVDYLPDEKKIKINLPDEVWKNIDTIIMTRLFQEELVVGLSPGTKCWTYQPTLGRRGG